MKASLICTQFSKFGTSKFKLSNPSSFWALGLFPCTFIYLFCLFVSSYGEYLFLFFIFYKNIVYHSEKKKSLENI
jgi:hypothetical protein